MSNNVGFSLHTTLGLSTDLRLTMSWLSLHTCMHSWPESFFTLLPFDYVCLYSSNVHLQLTNWNGKDFLQWRIDDTNCDAVRGWSYHDQYVQDSAGPYFTFFPNIHFSGRRVLSNLSLTTVLLILSTISMSSILPWHLRDHILNLLCILIGNSMFKRFLGASPLVYEHEA